MGGGSDIEGLSPFITWTRKHPFVGGNLAGKHEKYKPNALEQSFSLASGITAMYTDEC